MITLYENTITKSKFKHRNNSIIVKLAKLLIPLLPKKKQENVYNCIRKYLFFVHLISEFMITGGTFGTVDCLRKEC